MSFSGDMKPKVLSKRRKGRMNTQAEEYKRVKEQIAKQLAIQTLEDESLAGCDVWDWVVKNNFVEEYLEKADQILALNSIAILADDQNLP